MYVVADGEITIFEEVGDVQISIWCSPRYKTMKHIQHAQEIHINKNGWDITAVVASTLFDKATIPFSIPNLYAVYSYFKGER